jgi:hypothetical protein
VVDVEGLMSSGKSYLTERPFLLGTGHSVNIELDSFLRKPVDDAVKYMAAIDSDAAIKVIMEASCTAPMVIAEGPMAWPVVSEVLLDVSSHKVRRVYLKRMSSNYPEIWPDGDFLYEIKRPTAFGQSINDYHASERPWLLADVVFERIGRDDE